MWEFKAGKICLTANWLGSGGIWYLGSMKTSDLNAMREQANWLELCPRLTISSAPLIEKLEEQPCSELRCDDWNLCKDMMRGDGYFAYREWFASAFVDRLAEGFRQLDSAGLHPVYIFVFDEAWEVLLRLKPLLEDLLGDYLSLPAVWSWYVTPKNQTAFSPHRDQVHEVLIDDESHMDYLTIWVPLTDVDDSNSSICLLPASADPDFEEGVVGVRVENLQDIRSLQGPRGSVFCWSTQIAHWGTTQSEFGQPRMSLGFYVQRASAQCIDGPPIDFSETTNLEERLAIIGQQILDYSRTASDDELAFAAQLVNLPVATNQQ